MNLPFKNRKQYYVFKDENGTWISDKAISNNYILVESLSDAKNKYTELTGISLCEKKGCVCFCAKNKKACFVHTINETHWNYDEDGVMYSKITPPLFYN